MKSILIAVGKARAPFADADAHYLKLLSRSMPIELTEVRDDDAIVSRIPERCHLVALDVRGDQRDSMEWASWLERRRLEALDLCFVIGGPHGLPDEVVGRADELVSLGRQTIAHQLARAVLLEQLFRANKILAGETYHY